MMRILLTALIIGVSACASNKPVTETDIDNTEKKANEQRLESHSSNQEWMKISPEIRWADDALKKRFMSFWEAFYRRDWVAVFDLETPSFKNHFNAELYAQYHEKAHPLIDFEIYEIKYETTRALIKIRLKFLDPKTNKTNEMTLWDEWTKSDGSWYHVLIDPLLKKLVEEKNKTQDR